MLRVETLEGQESVVQPGKKGLSGSGRGIEEDQERNLQFAHDAGVLSSKGSVAFTVQWYG